MKECGLYRVLGPPGGPEYRGHIPGTVFPAQLEPRAEYRAIMRGSIERIGTQEARPGNFTLPPGWLESSTPPTAPEGAFFMPEGGK